MRIKNAAELIGKDLNENQLFLRKVAIQALEVAISAVKPKSLIENSIRIRDNNLVIQNDEYKLKKYNKIYIIGGGKATAEMLVSFESILSKLEKLDYEGIINVPKGSVNPEMLGGNKIKINYASHPIPDENGLNGTKQMMRLIEKSQKNDLIFCLISGGGSALLTLPKRGISLKDLQEVNTLLLASGASIDNINIIRKHISDFKGGNLAKKVYNTSGATLISIIISDVVGDKLDSIASGPTIADNSTFNDAIEVLKEYNIYEKIPISVINHLEEQKLDDYEETPKFNDECFNNVHNYLIGSVKSAVCELKSFLKNQGFKTNYFSKNMVGEAKEYGKSLSALISQYLETINKDIKTALIGTGELTVTIRGSGIGGRNQEMLLSFLNTIKDKRCNYNFSIISVNLDGIEGNSKAMGALVDNYTLEQMISRRIDTEKFLGNNDSNSFFKLVETEIVTGPTGCNVNDLVLVLLQFKKLQHYLS